MSKRKLVEYNDIDEKHIEKINHDFPKKSSKKNPQFQSYSTSCKRADNLMESIRVFLQNNPEADILEQLGDEGYNHCKALQAILRQKSQARKANPVAELLNGKDSVPKATEMQMTETMTPWTSNSIPKKTPKLPKILDPALEKQVFTHSSFDGGNMEANYERLEWLGDAYVQVISTSLIFSTFPRLDPGKSSQLREKLVRNSTMAAFSVEYGFDQQAILPPEFGHDPKRGTLKATMKEREKVLGDIFEAYCGAIIISDPKVGVSRLANWLKLLWARTISIEISELTTKEHKNKGSSKNELHMKLNGPGVAKLHYKDVAERKERGSNHPIFIVGVYLEGWGEEMKELGIGKAQSKKEAGDKAAEAALANKELLSVYEERKRDYDTKKLAREKEEASALTVKDEDMAVQKEEI